MKRLRLFLRDLFRRDRFEREMREELDAYVALSVDAHKRRGLSEDAARRAARLELGGLDQARERLRAERAGVFLDSLLQEPSVCEPPRCRHIRHVERICPCA